MNYATIIMQALEAAIPYECSIVHCADDDSPDGSVSVTKRFAFQKIRTPKISRVDLHTLSNRIRAKLRKLRAT